MVIGVERLAVRRAPDNAARLFEPLLGRVVAELTQWLPVVLAPEQFPGSLDPLGITAGLGILQSGRHFVIDDDRSNGPEVCRTHTAERMIAKECIARLLPAVSITTLGTAAPLITCHAGRPAEPRRDRLSSPANERISRSPRRHPGRQLRYQWQQPSSGYNPRRCQASP